MLFRLTSSLTAFALMLGLTSVSSAQLVFFDTAGPADWDTAANWDTGSLPDGTEARVHVGAIAGGAAAATATISGALTNPSVGELRIGSSSDGGATAGATGTVDHSAGTLNANNWSFIGVDGNTSGPANLGTYNLSGSGNLNSGSVLALGVGGNMGLNKGVVNISGEAVLNTNTGDGGFAIGWDLGNEGELNQTGGTINSNWVTVGANSPGTTGTYNVSGGVFNANGLTVGENTEATGTVNVSGSADINVQDILVGRNDTATGFFNIDGSTATIDASRNFFVGLNDVGADTTAVGTVSYTADAAGVTAVTADTTSLGDDANLIVDTSLFASTADILLVSNTNVGPVGGNFAGLPEGAVVPGSGGRTISYVYGDGNDIALVSAIPEPTAMLLCLVGLGAGLSRGRRS